MTGVQTCALPISEGFNATRVEYPKDKTVVDLFEWQAANSPEEIAVVSEGNELTYSELNNLSNKVAHYLVENGVQKNDVVVVYMPRNKWLMPAILGALKAGATYLPVATDLPKERVKFIIKDSNAVCVLCDTDYEELQEEGTSAPFVKVRELQAYSCENLHEQISPDDGSYRSEGTL